MYSIRENPPSVASMIVRISTLSESGLEIVSKLGLESLRIRMDEGTESPISFSEPPVVQVTVFPRIFGGEVSGEIRAPYAQECGRCLENCRRNEIVPFHYLLKRCSEGEVPEDDIGIAYFEGDHVDLEPLLQEVLILSLFPFWSPPIDSNSHCVLCGKAAEALDNEQEEAEPKSNPFADLLKIVKN